MKEFHQTLKAADLFDMVVIQLRFELDSSSNLDENVLESTNAAISARSGSWILKRPYSSCHSKKKLYLSYLPTDVYAMN